MDPAIVNGNAANGQVGKIRRKKGEREFGKDCTFWGGGVETVGTLNGSDQSKIRDQVFERMEIFSKEGGFIFNTVHNILPDVPPQNIITMFNAVTEFNNHL